MEGLHLIMNLSSIITGVPEYIEFGWVTAPNTAGQNTPANQITTLTLTTEVADTGNLVSAPSSNQFTLPAGTYYFEAFVPHDPAYVSYAGAAKAILSLYNVTDSTYVTRVGKLWSYVSSGDRFMTMNGQFVISSNKTFSLRIATSEGGVVGSVGNPVITMSGSTDDQRTTIKLWKLK